jgi:hypothetical protein
LLGQQLIVEPVTAQDAEWAAVRSQPAEGLSLGDRATGSAWPAGIGWTPTSGRRMWPWGSAGRIRQIR